MEVIVVVMYARAPRATADTVALTVLIPISQESRDIVVTVMQMLFDLDIFELAMQCDAL